MNKTIFITGSSSGIGRATAMKFLEKGWNVIASMRNPEKEKEFTDSPCLLIVRLDVTNPLSVKEGIKLGIDRFGSIDVIVNNAGYGAIGIFENATLDQVQKQFDTNVFGVMNVIREILLHFRQRKTGTIINITSMGGRITFPLYSLYHGTKWAIEGFSESLAYELRPLGIRVKLIEPGAIKTDFYGRSQELFQSEEIRDYDEYEKITLINTQKAGSDAPGPAVVADMVYRAANDTCSRLRYPAGKQAHLLLFLRRILPISWFMFLIRMSVENGFKR